MSGAILADEKLNGSLSVIRHTRDGWQYNIPLDIHVNDLDITVLRGKLKSQITDKLARHYTFGSDGRGGTYYSRVRGSEYMRALRGRSRSGGDDPRSSPGDRAAGR